MRRHNILIAAALVLLFSVPGFSQVLGGSGYLGIFDWFGVGRALVCMSSTKTKHWIDYKVVFGKVTVTNDEDTKVDCDFCIDPFKIPTGASIVTAVDACTSVKADGSPLTYPNPQAGGSGSTGGANGNQPAPGGMTVVVVEEERSRFGNAASGPPPYPETVPFRQFGLPPLYSGADLNITLRCNTGVNPTVFSVNHVSSIVYRDNMCTGARVAEIDVPTNALEVRVTPDGRWAIVTSFDNSISFIDTDTNKVAKIIRTDSNVNPGGVAIDPNSSYALVTSLGQPVMLVVDIAKQQIVSSIPIDRNFPQSVRLSPDATLAWVVFPFENVVEVLDIMTGIVNRSIPVPSPTDVVLNATGTVAYISSEAPPGSVLVVDTKTYAVTRTIPAAPGATDLLLSSDGRILTVNNYFGNSVTVIDTATLTGQTIPVAGSPRGAVAIPVQ